jgi:hypothetical protein
LRHALYSGYPPYPEDRVGSSIEILFYDLASQFPDFAVEMNVQRQIGVKSVNVPVVMTSRAGGRENLITIHSPHRSGSAY